MAQGDFGTAINCIDGRAQQPVADWLKLNHHVRYVDTVTAPGVDGLLAAGDPATIETLRQYVEVSTGAHESAVIAIAGHHGCAGNPVSKDEHLADIRRSVDEVAGWGLPARVVGLWVNESWAIEEVCARDAPTPS
ncbi:MAG TPA: carbonic anhydrase [Thermomicrobiales bacterium]|nr:carbonic anhydrase [Thermomicrobiales bacterium]